MHGQPYFYLALPDKTLEVKSRECKGGKLAKDRITIALTCPWKGEKLPSFVIGKSKKPRCFQNVDVTKLDSIYNSSKKAWMTNPLFNNFLLDLNQQMKNQRRKILLFIDNAPVHIIDSDTQSRIDSVKVIFFPPNLTSLLQALDGGIIRSLKARARKYSIYFEDAINFITQSWDEVTAATIQKCFRNAGFNWEDDCSDEDEPDSNDEASLSELLSQIGINNRETVLVEDLDIHAKPTATLDATLHFSTGKILHKKKQKVDIQVDDDYNAPMHPF